MFERHGVIIFMLGALFLMVASIVKGADDWQSQNLRNQLIEFDKMTEKMEMHEKNLDRSILPTSLGPFVDHQTFGLYYSWLAFQVQDRRDNTRFSEKAIEQFELQQIKRPLDSTVVINKANQMWRDGADFNRVIKEYHLAQKMGRYEVFTVIQSLKYYLAHWPKLSLSDKKQAISYLLDHNRYKMKIWQYDSILKLPVIGDRACNILAFNDVKSYFCHN